MCIQFFLNLQSSTIPSPPPPECNNNQFNPTPPLHICIFALSEIQSAGVGEESPVSPEHPVSSAWGELSHYKFFCTKQGLVISREQIFDCLIGFYFLMYSKYFSRIILLILTWWGEMHIGCAWTGAKSWHPPCCEWTRVFLPTLPQRLSLASTQRNFFSAHGSTHKT